MTPNEWITGRDTGISSKTIWAVMMGTITEETPCGDRFGVPHDSDDFGRCYRLLDNIPEWKERMREVAALLPAWRPFVREWDELTKLYEAELAAKTHSAPLSRKINQLVDESYVADGWKRTGPGSWSRDNV